MDSLAPSVLASKARLVDFRRFSDGLTPAEAFVDAIHPPATHYEAVVHAVAAQIEC